MPSKREIGHSHEENQGVERVVVLLEVGLLQLRLRILRLRLRHHALQVLIDEDLAHLRSLGCCFALRTVVPYRDAVSPTRADARYTSP